MLSDILPLYWKSIGDILTHITLAQKNIDLISEWRNKIDAMKFIYKYIPSEIIITIENRDVQKLYIDVDMPIGIHFLVNNRQYDDVEKLLIKGVNIKLLEGVNIDDKIAQLIVKYIPIDRIIERHVLARKLSKHVNISDVECDVCKNTVNMVNVAWHKCSFNYCTYCCRHIDKCIACNTKLII